MGWSYVLTGWEDALGGESWDAGRQQADHEPVSYHPGEDNSLQDLENRKCRGILEM